MLITQTISGVAKDGLTIGKPRKVNSHTSQRITIKGANGSKAVISVVFEDAKAAKKTARRGK